MPPISVMLKPASSMCNMSCKYCFYSDVSSLRKAHNLGMMSMETAACVIEKALSYAGGSDVYFTFQGGEPLLCGIGFYKKFNEMCMQFNTDGSKISFCIQTNGLLIDNEWADFFRDSGYLVGLSLDGGFEHNKYRVDKNGRPVFHRVLDASRLLAEKGVEFNILSVVTALDSGGAEKIYDYFKHKSFGYLQFIPCLRPFGNKGSSKIYMTGKQYGDFLSDLFRCYYRDAMNGEYVSIRQFDNYIRLYMGESAEQCGMNGHCTRQFVTEGNGNVYPCDFYCTDEWLLGNINETDFLEMSRGERAVKFIEESMKPVQRCKDCRLWGLCRSCGCRRNRESDDFCEAYKMFFKESLPLLENLVNSDFLKKINNKI